MNRSSRTPALWAVPLLACALSCGKTSIRPGDEGTAGSPTAGSGLGGNTASSVGGSGASNPVGKAGTGGEGAFGGAVCDDSWPVEEKRLVRLSFRQVVATLRVLLGDAFADRIQAELEISEEPAFPELASPMEGFAVTDPLIVGYDRIALEAGQHVLDHLDLVTGCGPTPSDACAQKFLAAFAERALRRPVDAGEWERLLAVYDATQVQNGSTAESLATAVSALLHWPQFIYRTEFGEDPLNSGPLGPYEVASQLAYAFRGGPPDDELLEAAATGELSDEAGIGAQAARLLTQPETQRNFESALLSYFNVWALRWVIVDDSALTRGKTESLLQSGTLFLQGTLWSEPLSALLTSSRAWMNPTLGSLYGIDVPSGVAEDEFVQVAFDPPRGGMLTHPAFLLPTSRPDSASITARGLLVSAKLLCLGIPPLTESDAPPLRPGPEVSRRQSIESVLAQESCVGCHEIFDPFGLALEHFDVLGRYQTSDTEGRPIDTEVTLPALDDITVRDALELQARIAESPKFTACMTRAMLTWVLSSIERANLDREDCAAQQIAARLARTDGTLSALLHQIAISPAFRERRGD